MKLTGWLIGARGGLTAGGRIGAFTGGRGWVPAAGGRGWFTGGRTGNWLGSLVGRGAAWPLHWLMARAVNSKIAIEFFIIPNLFFYSTRLLFFHLRQRLKVNWHISRVRCDAFIQPKLAIDDMMIHGWMSFFDKRFSLTTWCWAGKMSELLSVALHISGSE